MKRKDYFLLIGILVIHLVLLIVLKFTAWPEMSLWPYLITKGWLPYRDIAVAHTPLMLFDLSLFYKIFGTAILQLKIFTWILILFTDGLVFAVVRKIWNQKSAFLATIFFAVWMLLFDGNGLWFDLYMGLLAFCSFYFAARKNWLWTGIFWALAFISKQTAVWFLIPLGLEMLRPFKVRPLKVVAQFVTGALSIFIPFILLLFAFHLLPSFWNWAVKFGVFILPKAQGQIQLPDLKALGVAVFPFLIFVPLILETGKKNINLLIWALAGAMGTYPRFEYFHFQPAIPYLAIATALGIESFKDKRNLFIKIFIPVYILGNLYILGSFFIRNFNEGTRFYEKDVVEVADYVKYNTSPGDPIFVMNWWDNIYALTNTLPSTDPWIPQLSWYTEIPGIQEKMIADLQENPPSLIVFKPYTNFGLSSYIPEKIYNYVMANYTTGQKVDGVVILTRKQYAYSNFE